MSVCSIVQRAEGIPSCEPHNIEEATPPSPPSSPILSDERPLPYHIQFSHIRNLGPWDFFVIAYLRTTVSDDRLFVEKAVQLIDSMDEDKEEVANTVLSMISTDGLTNPNIVAELMNRGAYDENVLSFLKTNHPDRFFELLLKVELYVFTKICLYNPELIENELALELVEKKPIYTAALCRRRNALSEFLEEAIKRNPSVIAFIHEDKEILTPYDFEFVMDDGSIVTTRALEYYLLAYQTDPASIGLIHDSEISVELFAYASRLDPNAFWDLSNIIFMLADPDTPPEIIEDLLREDPTRTSLVNAQMRYDPRFYPILRGNPLTADFAQFPHGGETRGRFWSDFDYNRIIDVHRPDLENRIAADPQNPSHPDKPVALLIYGNAENPENTFEHSNEMHRLLEAGYEVAYYEITNEHQFAFIMKNYLPLLRSGDTVILGGHGQQGEIALSYAVDERNYLDLQDAGQFKAAFENSKIPDGVNLILHSCSNASGGMEANNAMNLFYDVFGGKWHLYAMDQSADFYASFDNGRLVSITQWDGTLYHIFPGTRAFETHEANINLYHSLLANDVMHAHERNTLSHLTDILGAVFTFEETTRYATDSLPTA